MASRTVPYFGKVEPHPGNAAQSTSPAGCIWAIVVVCGSYFVLMSIQRVTSGSGSRLDHYICYGTLIALAVLILAAAIQRQRDWQRERAAREKWMQAARSAELSIVKRVYYPGGTSDDGYNIHTTRPDYRLYLAMNAGEAAAFPATTVVEVSVGETFYKSLQDRTSIHIYYHPDSPLTFLLEGE